MASPRGRYAIAGIGETAVGRLPHRTGDGLRLEAAARAISDSGLPAAGIDGVIAWQPRSAPRPNYATYLSDRLGLTPAYVNDVSLGGAGAVALVINAVAALKAGLCSAVLCVSGSGGGGPAGRLASLSEDFKAPFGADPAPVLYGLAARRHMHQYGTTSRQLGAVAVACRRHASLNPNAQMREPITVEDHQRSRMLADPFRLLDCSLVSDGAGALVITDAKRAADLPHAPVYVLGMGSASAFGEIAYAECPTTTGGKDAAARAFKMAGVRPADIDVLELYDCFTSVVIMTLEDYGFCAKGEGGPFVEGGRIELGGEIPVNTHGGLLSQAHVGGVLHLTEAVTQLRGAAGDRQVAGAQVAAVSGQCGEQGIHMTVVLGSAPD